MKKTTWILLTATLIFCCTGCQKENPKPKEKILTVCVEEELFDYTRDLLDLWEMLNEGVQGKLEVIPQDTDTAEIKAVSYTHLDVYKRQILLCVFNPKSP